MKRVVCALLVVTLLMGVAVLAVSADAILYGDADGNGKINNRDLGLLQKYLNDDVVNIDLTAMDVDDNGKINNRDLGLLQKYLNDDDVTLGPDKPVIPPAELPAVGYDIDGKGRIMVSAISQEDYTVTVSLHNYSDKWITEETSCVLYTCTDAEGNELYLNDKYFGILYFGMMEVGDTVTFNIDLPEGTAKLEFGDSRIVYWSQWVY